MRVASSLRGCLDCDDLLSGASRRLVPHQYLVLSRRVGSTGRMEYQCLVCRSNLAYEAGADPTWSLGSPGPSGTPPVAQEGQEAHDGMTQNH